MSKILLLLALLSCFVGCASTDSMMTDTTKRKPTTDIKVMTVEPDPNRFKSIGMVQFLGAKEDELKAMKFLQREAMKLGADAIWCQQEQFQKWVGFTPTIAVKYKATLYVSSVPN